MKIKNLINECKRYEWLGSGVFNNDDKGLNSAEIDIISTLKKDGIIRIHDPIFKKQWDKFEYALSGISKNLIVITDGVPKNWVTNKKLHVVQIQSVLQNTLKKLDKFLKKYNFNHYHRQATSLEYDYFLLYGRFEYHKETIVKELELRKILNRSLYSRPTTGNVLGRSIEDKKIDAPIELRFSHDNNFEIIISNAQKCHCCIVLESGGLYEGTDSTITEKSIWPILSQVPFVWSMGANKTMKLQEWGFMPNDNHRMNLRLLVEQLLWLKSEFNSKERSQIWQNEQGETINANLKKLRNLDSVIEEEIYNQMIFLGF